MMVHIAVHSRCYDQRARSRYNGGCQRIICQTQGQLGDGVHRCRSYNDNICLLGQGHMFNAVFGIWIKRVRHYRTVGDATESHGSDKLGCAVTHDDVNQCPGLHQLAGQV